MSAAQLNAVAEYRKLHESGCFVLPNPWDIGSAIYLHRAGFKAVATTSAGYAFTRGLPDDVLALSLEDVLAHNREIASATPLPVNSDFQSGYADESAGVFENVQACVATGVAGLSIEDSTGRSEQPLYERGLAIERIKAARAAIDATGVPVVLTARCEAWLVGQPDPAPFAIDRLVAFAEAGADCLYAPGVKDLETIREIVKAVAPKPINVLVSASIPGITVASLAEAGVRRVSVGSALSRVAWGAFMRSAQEMLHEGTFAAFNDAVPFGEINGVFQREPTRSV